MDSRQFADADHSAMVNEENHGALDEAVRALGWGCVAEAVQQEGVLTLVAEARVPLGWFLEEFEEYAEEAAQECRADAEAAYSDRYTRRAEQGFYDG